MVSGVSVGIDYHLKELRVCVLDPEGRVIGDRRVGNCTRAVEQYVRRYGEVRSVALEACTGSANFAAELKQLTGWSTRLCHPGYAQRMRHNPDKSDKSDAYLVADLNRVGYLPEVWLAPESLRDLRMLVRYRKQLVEERSNVKLRIRAMLRVHRIAVPDEYGLWSKKGLQWIQSVATQLPEHASWVFQRHLFGLERVVGEVLQVEKRLGATLQDDRLAQRLLQEPGIGLVTAAVMRAEIGTFTRFRTGKQLSRFCGVTPRNASSGERQADAGLVKAGNGVLKTSLMEVGQVLRRIDPRWRQMSNELKARGKAGAVITAAVANRWVRQLHHTMCSFEQEVVQ